MSNATALLPTGTWTVDASHSNVGFTVRHMMVAKTRGRFTDFTAEIVTSDDPTQSRVDATVQLASIDTNDEARDNHLRTNDFFDVQTYPTMSFRTTSVEPDGDDFKLNGELTIRGVTKPVTFDLEVGGVGTDPWGNTKAGFSATTTINRKDFGITWNAPLETGGVIVGDKVNIELDIEAKLES